MIAGHAMNRKIQCRKELATMRVSPGRIVLDQVPCQGDDISLPVA